MVPMIWLCQRILKKGKFGVTDSLETVNLFDEMTLLSSVIFSNKGQDYSHNFYRAASEMKFTEQPKIYFT